MSMGSGTTPLHVALGMMVFRGMSLPVPVPVPVFVSMSVFVSMFVSMSVSVSMEAGRVRDMYT